MTSIAIVNQHTNNYGDDAAGSALVQQVISTLEARSVDIFYIWHESGSGLPVDDRCTHHFPDLLSGASDARPRLALAALARMVTGRVFGRDLRRMVARCKEADAVFVSPAGSNIGIYKDWMYLLVLVILVLEGVRPTFCQNTVAASNSRVFNRVAMFVLRRSRMFVREAASQEWLASQRIGAYLGVDTAVLLPPATRPSGEDLVREYVALVPTSLATWHRDFREFDDHDFAGSALPDAVGSFAREEGLDVVIVPHLYGPAAEPELLRRLHQALADRGCRTRIAEVATFDDYRTVLAGAAMVVSMRYHGLVLAAHSNVPCVALSYENKMREAAAYFGISDFATDVSSSSAAQIGELLRRCRAERASISARMAEANGELRAVAMGPILDVRSRLLRAPGV